MDAAETLEQPWFCEQCGAAGKVPYVNQEGVWAVVSAIGQAHQRLSPGCNVGYRNLRCGEMLAEAVDIAAKRERRDRYKDLCRERERMAAVYLMLSEHPALGACVFPVDDSTCTSEALCGRELEPLDVWEVGANGRIRRCELDSIAPESLCRECRPKLIARRDHIRRTTEEFEKLDQEFGPQ